jgi:molybdopterin molybdotransferase
MTERDRPGVEADGRPAVAEARQRLLAAADPHGRTDRVPLASADGRTVAAPVTAATPVPARDCAAVDGWAVRARDTTGAGSPPARLRVVDGDRRPGGSDAGDRPDAADGTATRVSAGRSLPQWADAVAPAGDAECEDGTVSVVAGVDAGDHVTPTGADAREGRQLYAAGDALDPSDLGLVKAAGVDRVSVAARPTVGVVPTGSTLVQRDPDPGETIETNGLTLATLVERWGGIAQYRDVVPADPAPVRVAIQRDLTKDAVVTVGGTRTATGVVADLGEVVARDVAVAPGGGVALGTVAGTPVVALPAAPVAAVVDAVQFLRPLLAHLAGAPRTPHPTHRATLDAELRSDPGTRTFVPVRLRAGGGARRAVPLRAAAGVADLASADGWVAVPGDGEGHAAGDSVTVERWLPPG